MSAPFEKCTWFKFSSYFVFNPPCPIFMTTFWQEVIYIYCAQRMSSEVGLLPTKEEIESISKWTYYTFMIIYKFYTAKITFNSLQTCFYQFHVFIQSCTSRVKALSISITLFLSITSISMSILVLPFSLVVVTLFVLAIWWPRF